MAYGCAFMRPVRCSTGTPSVPGLISKEGIAMKNLIKSQAFRTLMLLSALVSSGLVLEAARRW
jgi:hypothetical protein